MSPHEYLEPKEPSDAGIPQDHPRPAQEEAAHQLAAEARPRLEDRGFSDVQIDDWADAYLARGEAGDVEHFLSWVQTQES